MTSLMGIIAEESVIILKSGIEVRGTTQVSIAIQLLKDQCYTRGVNTGFVYATVFGLGIIASVSLVKKFKNRKKEA